VTDISLRFSPKIGRSEPRAKEKRGPSIPACDRPFKEGYLAALRGIDENDHHANRSV
jgi:hypothetical protein